MNEAQEADRYHKLRAWLIQGGKFTKLEPANSAAYALGDTLFGPTFDAAVDSLPEIGPKAEPKLEDDAPLPSISYQRQQSDI
jgi:hypothetical protein